MPGHQHAYLSTACYHELADRDPSLHDACRSTCKFCDASCSCPAHRKGEQLTAPDGGWVGQARSIAKEIYAHVLTYGILPPELVRRVSDDPALFWLRGEEQSPGTWRPPELQSRHPVPTRIIRRTKAEPQPCAAAKLAILASNQEAPRPERGGSAEFP
jgi:hypothetical protein